MASIEVDGQNVPIEPVTFAADDRRDVSRLARSEHGKNAATLVAAELVSSFLGAGGGTRMTQENAARVLEEMSENSDVFAAAATESGIVLPSVQFAEPVVAPEPEPAASVATLSYELPPDVAALLEEDDDDDPSFTDPVAEVDEIDEPDEFETEREKQLRQQLEKERRRVAHERGLRVQTARKDWEAEAKRVFNTSVELVSDDEVSAVTAESKREFFRQVKEIADRNKRIAERFAPQPAAPADPLVAAREQIRAEERAKLEQERWGTPAVTNTPVSGESLAQQDALARARRSGNLAAIIKARLYPEQ